MLATYLNDNQAMPYPFYGYGSLPFPMSVITGLGICINTNTTPGVSVNALFASSVVITEDAVRVAICRKTVNEDSIELIGMFYANKAGYYTYIPSFVNDAVYEDQTITPHMLRFVYSDYAPVVEDTTTEAPIPENQMDWDDHTHTIELDAIIEDMQVFYSYVRANVGALPGQIESTGYIQLGSIPESAVGAYTGEFYLDPSCCTYMPDTVYGHHAAYTINKDTYAVGRSLDIMTSGLLTVHIDGTTATFGTTPDADASPLVQLDMAEKKHVTSVKGYTVHATAENPYPVVYITGQTQGDKPVIHFEPVVGVLSNDTIIGGGTAAVPDTAVVVAIVGTTAFPNCYGSEDEAEG